MAYVKIRLRRSTKEQWEYANPILSEGEVAVEVPETGVGTGLVNLKFGDGVTPWNALPYGFNAALLSKQVNDLQRTVSDYTERIENLENSVDEIQNKITNIRKIEIQLSEPSDNLTLGEIWISTDIITGSIALNKSTITLDAGESDDITLVNTLSEYDGIVWTSSNETVATLSNKTSSGCRVTANQSGTAIVTASAYLHDAVIYNVSCKITVDISGTVNITPATQRIVIGKSAPVFLVNTISSFDDIEWMSSYTNIAAITNSSNTQATIKGLLGGTSTIYARVKLNGAIIANAMSSVNVVGMRFNEESVSIDVGDTTSIGIVNTMVEGADYDIVEWITSDDTVAEIIATDNYSCNIRGLSAGVVNISAVAKWNGEVVQAIAIQVGVVGHVKLSDDAMTLGVGGAAAITMTNTLSPTQYDTIVWNSSDPNVATVSNVVTSEAIIDAIGDGVALITVSALLDGVVVDNATCTVTVDGSLIMDEISKEVSVGSTVTLTATNTLNPAAYNRIKWTTSDSAICDVVSFNGTSADITGVAVGTATITVFAVDGDGASIASDICRVTVSSL